MNHHDTLTLRLAGVDLHAVIDPAEIPSIQVHATATAPDYAATQCDALAVDVRDNHRSVRIGCHEIIARADRLTLRYPAVLATSVGDERHAYPNDLLANPRCASNAEGARTRNRRSGRGRVRTG